MDNMRRLGQTAAARQLSAAGDVAKRLSALTQQGMTVEQIGVQEVARLAGALFRYNEGQITVAKSGVIKRGQQ